jgi:hypothetical protein
MLLSSIDPAIGFLAVIAAGTITFLAFRFLDRHSARRSQ